VRDATDRGRRGEGMNREAGSQDGSRFRRRHKSNAA
jgi:hypothetical protein